MSKQQDWWRNHSGALAFVVAIGTTLFSVFGVKSQADSAKAEVQVVAADIESLEQRVDDLESIDVKINLLDMRVEAIRDELQDLERAIRRAIRGQG